MYCLRCQSPMRQVVLKGILVDFCDTCKSCWLDAGELDRLRAGKGKPAKALQREREVQAQAEKELLAIAPHLCPRCQQPLELHYEGRVQLDRCTVCGGLFFDHGELQKCLDLPRKNWLHRLAEKLTG